MSTSTFSRSSHLPVSLEEAFAWHTRVGAFDRLMPSWIPYEILERKGTIYDGDLLKIKSRIGLFPYTFQVKHQNFIPNSQFQDVQIRGPFSYWQHTHKFNSIEEHKSKITDDIEYALPTGIFSRLVSSAFIDEKLDRLFTYRHRTLHNDLYLHSCYSQKKLKILVTGSSGLVGSELVPFLTTGGHTVIKLSRQASLSSDTPNVVFWNSTEKKFENADILENIDAVVHLAGENIADKRWSLERKKQLVESRVQFTKDLINALLVLKTPPKTFIAASGIGIFGSRDYDDVLTENSKLGQGFLAKLAQNWEDACVGAKQNNIRVVNLRFGSIISLSGGILKKMYTPYRLFLGGPIGTGKQMISWISITDVLGIILFSLSNNNIVGALNTVSPNSVTNEEFSEILAQTLDRPNSVRIPKLVVESIFGEMGKELLLSGQHAKPHKALKYGYEFLHSELHDALTHCLGF